MWLVEAVRLDSEPGPLMTAFARHRDSKERHRQVERIPLDSASSQLADDSYSMCLRNTTLAQPVSDTRSTWQAAEKLFWHARTRWSHMWYYRRTLPPYAQKGRPAKPFQFSLPLFRGVAEAALYCAHRTSTVSSCAFCEQKGYLAAPLPLLADFFSILLEGL